MEAVFSKKFALEVLLHTYADGCEEALFYSVMLSPLIHTVC
jgi:hypothetical protein